MRIWDVMKYPLPLCLTLPWYLCSTTGFVLGVLGLFKAYWPAVALGMIILEAVLLIGIPLLFSEAKRRMREDELRSIRLGP